MVAWMDRTALTTTVTSGQAHFWSRSRAELWRKGATSGNTMEVVGFALDCDGDTVLMTVSPAGPACHTGTASCFDSAGHADHPGFDPRALPGGGGETGGAASQGLLHRRVGRWRCRPGGEEGAGGGGGARLQRQGSRRRHGVHRPVWPRRRPTCSTTCWSSPGTEVASIGRRWCPRGPLSMMVRPRSASPAGGPRRRRHDPRGAAPA